MDVKLLLEKMGYTELQDFGKEYRTSPLYRTSDNKTSLCINKQNGQWYDFGARDGGSIVGLAKLTCRLKSLEEAKKFLGDSSIMIDDYNCNHKYELVNAKIFDKNLLLKLQKDHSYWENRGISKNTIEIFQGGVTYNGKMCYRYTFPIFNDKDNLVGFSGRRLNDNPDYPKWKSLGVKSHWCYPLKWNKEFILKTKEVILVESIGDMLSLWENGIKNTLVTFGIDIGIKIVEFLLKIDAKRIFIAFNNDSDNQLVGNKAAIEMKKFLLKHFDPHQVIIAIPNEKDFGEMNFEQIELWKNTYNIK